MNGRGLARTLGVIGLGVAALGLAGALGSTPGDAAPASNKVLVIGMDGGEWSVLEEQWAKGKLPNLKKLVDRGVSAKLKTQYGQSPVIWTTIATGQDPNDHGITGFVVATDDGDVPVSSEMRTVPAVWNIASSADLKTNVIGWWGSWPAEPVSGVNVTERCQQDVPGCATPADFEKKVKAALPSLNSTHAKLFPGEQSFAPEDRVVTEFAPKLAADGFDAMFVYLHGSDPNSHKYWRYYRPSDFDKAPPADGLKQHANKVPKAYQSIDTVIGRILDKAGSDTNIIIVSDHGFHPLDEITVKVALDVDAVLAELGYATLEGKKVDVSTSKVFAYGSKTSEIRKRMRFNMDGRDAGGLMDEAAAAQLLGQLKTDLARVTYKSGQPVFDFVPATGRDKQRGADFVLEILGEDPSRELMLDGKPMKAKTNGWVENSGGHSGDPPGLFIAAGPDIDPKANVDGVRIHDITPTVLYGLGLPVAKDMEGKAWTTLYSGDFQSRHPLKEIDSYGTRDAGNATATGEDETITDQLRALGYMD